MKWNHVSTMTVVSVVVPFQIIMFIGTAPTVTYGMEFVDDSFKYDFIDDDQDVFPLEQGLWNLRAKFTFRLMEEDDTTCVNVCNNDTLSTLQAIKVEEMEVEDNSFFGCNTYFFDQNKNMFGRWMNGLLKLLDRQNGDDNDDPKYSIPTDQILPLLSNYSIKFKSLATMIRKERVDDAALSTTPDAIRMLYNISAANMESIASVLDPILEEFRQEDMMDVRAVSCHMMSLLTLRRDTTVPNIERMTQLIYTKSNRDALKDRFTDYTISTENQNAAFAVVASSDDCPNVSSKTTSARLFVAEGLLQFLFNSSVDVGPIEHIVRIILLIVLFPLSIVVSLVGVIVFIVYLLANFLRLLLGNNSDTTNDGFEGLIIVVIFTVTIGAPFFVVATILRNIRGFFEDVLNPFLPDRPTPAPTIFTPFPTRFPTLAQNAPGSAPLSRRVVNTPILPPVRERDAQQASDVMHRLSLLLESPVDTISAVFQNENIFSDTSKGVEEEVDCEMAELICKNDALIDVLPF